eukprot:TRINITY_DN4072_c0_g1_i1.p1 TRINITY_DN4072_c0_g1~~TRINITY_DN4072_c0_g1_i1.p1  ORF type:complete len:262 (-),score=74.91 TRINITY_DN4072_c0_g1_i1:188-973(-)
MMLARRVNYLRPIATRVGARCFSSASANQQPKVQQKDQPKPDIDTSGAVSDINSKIGGILGLQGAPLFVKGDNVIDIIKNDHRTVEELYEKYKSAKDTAKKQELAWTITKELVQHSEVEQIIVYPLLKMRDTPDGQHLHDRSLSEHQEIRELLYALDQTKVTDPSHPAKLKAAIEAVIEHVKEEESEVLPLIEKEYTLEERQYLGAAFQFHKYGTVTRPHPSAPLQGPFAAMVGMATKPIDLARDLYRSTTEKVKEDDSKK